MELKELKEMLAEVSKKKEAKHEVMMKKSYPVLPWKEMDEKAIFGLMKRVKWVGKEALGVVHMFKSMQHAFGEAKKNTTGKDVMFNSTQMNALLYLLGKIESTSYDDAKIYVDKVYTFVVALEENAKVAQADYKAECGDMVAEIEKLEDEIKDLELKEEEATIESANKSETTEQEVVEDKK